MEVNRRGILLAGGAVAAGAAAAGAVVAGALTLGKSAAPGSAGNPLVLRQAENAALGPFVPRPIQPPVTLAPATFVDGQGVAHGIAAFAGSGLVINLWATWCLPCVAEMPALAQLARNLAGSGIRVLPLSSDRGGEEVVRKWYAAHRITDLDVWLDPRGAAKEAWGARGIPTTLLVDAQGRERARAEGPFAWDAADTAAAIRALLA